MTSTSVSHLICNDVFFNAKSRQGYKKKKVDGEREICKNLCLFSIKKQNGGREKKQEQKTIHRKEQYDNKTWCCTGDGLTCGVSQNDAANLILGHVSDKSKPRPCLHDPTGFSQP